MHVTHRWSVPSTLLVLLVPLWLFTGCPAETTLDDDDAADDDASDDDMWADDDDAADDDDVADDDDDAAAGDPCVATVGPPEMPIDLDGTCAEDDAACEGGFDPGFPEGSCASGLTCCIHTDQCETVMMGTCAASDDECEGEPPEGAPGFPPFGCPESTPICCIPEPPR